MDYHDQNAGKARLAVAKYAATAPQKAGTLFTNPGEWALRSVSSYTNLVSQVGLVTLESSSSQKADRSLAPCSRELSMLSPGILVALVYLRCMYSLLLFPSSLTSHIHPAPARLRASIPKLRRTRSLITPSFGKSTIPSPGNSTSRTQTNSFPMRTRVLVCFLSLGRGVNRVLLVISCNSSGPVQRFVIWSLLGIVSSEKTNRSTTGVSPTAP